MRMLVSLAAVCSVGLVLAGAGATIEPLQKPDEKKAAKVLTPEEAQAMALEANALRQKTVQLLNNAKYEEALKANTRANELYESLKEAAPYPQAHVAVAAGWGLHAAILKLQGKDAESLPFAERALALFDDVFPPAKFPQGTVQTNNTLDFLGLVHYELGSKAYSRESYREAAGYFERAVQVYERRHPQGHPELAKSLNNLGGALLMAGEHHHAIGPLKRALAIREKGAGYSKEELAKSLNNVGSLLRDQGEWEEARSYLERASKIFEVLHPAGHADRALHLNNLGNLYANLKEAKLAAATLDQALAMFRKAYPDGHADLIGCLQSRANVASDLEQDHRGAGLLLEDSLRLCGRLFPVSTYPRGNLVFTGAHHNLGIHHFSSGKLELALDSLQRCVAMSEKLFPEEDYPLGHPHLAMVLASLGKTYFALEQYDQAGQHLERSLNMYHSWAHGLFAGLSEAESLNIAARIPSVRDALITVRRQQGKGPLAVDRLYGHLWRSKSAVTQIIERRQQILGRIKDAEASALWQELIEVRQALSRLVLAEPSPQQAQARRDRLRKLTAHKEDLERKLAALPNVAKEITRGKRGHAELLRSLPEGVAFVDFLRYGRQKPQQGATSFELLSEPQYAAFVLVRGKPVEWVELGPAEGLDAAVPGFRRAIQTGQSSGKWEGVLQNQVWHALEHHFHKARVVLLCPDGALTAVPWAALPGAKPGSILLDHYALALAPHGPFLLEQLSLDRHALEKEGEALLAGGVDYDGASRETVRPDRDRERGRSQDEPRWSPLPGTLKELQAVAELAGKRKTKVLHGGDASSAQVLVQLPKARWAHLATHGFFADPSQRSALQGGSEGPGALHAGGRNPLLLSGLVWAGANRSIGNDPRKAAMDAVGILTGESIASLPLHNLDLVVLSACETGLGEVAAGEGVFGLQRAFHQAGACQVVGSLWKVDDSATVALMLLFYQHHWQKGQSTLAALRSAQLELHRHPRKIDELTKDRGLEPLFPTKAKANPLRFWAAWNVSGVTRAELEQLTAAWPTLKD